MTYLRVLALATLVALTAVGQASASSPPQRTLAFDPLSGSIAGVRLGDSIAGVRLGDSIAGVRLGDSIVEVTRLLGPPDRIIPLGDGTPVSLWLSGPKTCSAWAEAYPVSRSSHRLVYFLYRGRFATSRGDRLGTPLAVLRKHWQRGWQYVRKVTGAPGPNYGRVAHWGSATFGFDGRRRLGGISIQTSAQIWQPVVFSCP